MEDERRLMDDFPKPLSNALYTFEKQVHLNYYMPLQNRVTPFSTIVATPERGAWTGNRGVIHNEQQQIIKHHAVKYWITCVLEYKGKRRPLMTPKRWTELFFLDEATAFAAGHRPCGFCRYPAYKKFKELWLQAHAATYGLKENTSIQIIDALIHKERLGANNTQQTFTATMQQLPSGVLVKQPQEPHAFLWWQGQLYQWSFGGYQLTKKVDPLQTVEVLTPRSYVEVFRLGYVPQVDRMVGL